ncbi:uncharacterized protein LOC143527288 [Brachyhypopomus gauderio]|uniref:uncharacterized protein LOC143527288 n=1 Tax=Brachyhypopomus gauderio TaxID=698409 RepID=UPI0040415655
MGSSRLTLVTVMCVVFFSQKRISGVEVERRGRRGECIVIYSDCVLGDRMSIVWYRKSSQEHQSAVKLRTDGTIRYSAVWDKHRSTWDLLIQNITESDLGLYYCAVNISGGKLDYGHRTTRLSLMDPSFDTPHPTYTSTPPVPECGVCWTLLITVCPVCVLLSSTCVYCLCHKRHTGSKKRNENIFQVGCVEEHQCEWSVNGEICYHTEISYTPLRSTLKSD